MRRCCYSFLCCLLGGLFSLSLTACQSGTSQGGEGGGSSAGEGGSTSKSPMHQQLQGRWQLKDVEAELNLSGKQREMAQREHKRLMQKRDSISLHLLPNGSMVSRMPSRSLKGDGYSIVTREGKWRLEEQKKLTTLIRYEGTLMPMTYTIREINAETMILVQSGKAPGGEETKLIWQFQAAS